jgi:putative glutamine amidotransferase
MRSKPLIGILPGYDTEKSVINLRSEYAFGVAEAGGFPVLLPVPGMGVPDEQWLGALDCLDGLLASGGPDLAPTTFGEQPIRGLGAISPERDRFELAMVGRALTLDMPVLGICRGIQVLAVAAGGTLYQDINSQVAGILKHRQEAPYWHVSHNVKCVPGSILAVTHGCEEFMTNTFHHQTVKDVPRGFVATAHAPDGLIEGIESTTHRLAFGVQWHPEGIWSHDRLHLATFRRLVEAARRSG